MTKEQYIKSLKIRFSNDPSYKTIDELGFRDKLEYNANRKKRNSMNSGYFMYAEDGDIIDISNQCMETGYIWISSSFENIMRSGGRLATGVLAWSGDDD